MRGFTLMELMIVVALVATSGFAISSLGWSLHRVESSSAAYHEDLFRLRRAVQTIERDARAGDLGRYRLESHALLRDGVILLRRVATFDVTTTGRVSAVTLALQPRSDTATRRAEVRFEVAVR